MKRIFYILLLIAGCIPSPLPAQYPMWTDFYMAKIGSYYSLNVYKTPIRAWMTPDTTRFFFGNSDSLGHKFSTSYLRSDTFDIFTNLTGDSITVYQVKVTGLAVDASPDSALSVVDGLIKMAAWPTGGAATLWETDSNGDLQPVLAGTTDALWELDENGDLQPQI